MEFIDTSDFTSTNPVEHFMATDLEWDPTGRYVVTGSSYWIHRVCSTKLYGGVIKSIYLYRLITPFGSGPFKDVLSEKLFWTVSANSFGGLGLRHCYRKKR